MLDYEIIRSFAEEIILYHDFEGMEAILYTDGDYTIRQHGSMSPYEDEIMVKMPLGNAYWGYSDLWGKDLDEEKELVETAIDELVEDINYRIWIWEAEEDERAKMKAYHEEEVRRLENMFGFQRNFLRRQAEELLESEKEMKYLVVEDTGGDIYFEKFETLREANHRAWYTHKSNQKLPKHCARRKYHIFVATMAGDDDMDMEDSYFDSKTFYLPEEEIDFDALWHEVTDTIGDNNGDLDFVLENGKFVFSVPWNLIEEHFIEEFDEFDEAGGEIIFKYYKDAVQEKRDEILAFYELD